MAFILQTMAVAQTHHEPITAKLCEVVASPERYNHRVLTVDGVLSPSEHSLTLYSPSCKPRQNVNVVLQDEWKFMENGKRLRKLLHGHKEAPVKLSGTFESGAYSYGPDGAPFRFVVSEILSVEKQP